MYVVGGLTLIVCAWFSGQQCGVALCCNTLPQVVPVAGEPNMSPPPPSHHHHQSRTRRHQVTTHSQICNWSWWVNFAFSLVVHIQYMYTVFIFNVKCILCVCVCSMCISTVLKLESWKVVWSCSVPLCDCPYSNKMNFHVNLLYIGIVFKIQWWNADREVWLVYGWSCTARSLGCRYIP